MKGKIAMKTGGVVMPNRDGTGPNGMGPCTGWRAAACSGYGKWGLVRPRLNAEIGRGYGNRQRLFSSRGVLRCARFAIGWIRHNRTR